MTWDTFKKIVDSFSLFKGICMTINFHADGEPLFDPLIFKKIAYVKNKLPYAYTNLVTNGTLLDEDKAEQLIKSHIDQVVFSLNGASVASYQQISKGAEYPIILNNLIRYFDICKNSQTSPVNIVQLVICDINRHEIDEFKKLWSNRADQLVIKAMHSFLDMKTSTLTSHLTESQINKCLQPYQNLIIYWNGDIGHCCWDYNNFANIGNIRDGHLLAIFNNRHFRETRSAMDKIDCHDIVLCNRCSQIYGNDAKAILETQSCMGQHTKTN